MAKFSLAPLALALLTGLLGACSADFKSGETKCSSLDKSCPEGFVCASNGTCVTAGTNVEVATGGAGGTGSGGRTGSGGAPVNPGTGGTPATPGTGGTPATPDAGPVTPDAASACSDPKEPLACPAKGNLPATCWPAGYDCSTVMACDGKVYACPTGTLNDCRYPNCIPANMMCPVSYKYCPAAGGAGPTCRPTAHDCATVVFCEGKGLGSCPTGQKFNCTTGMCDAGTMPGACNDPKFPTLCPAKAPAPAICAGPDDDCSTVSKCGDRTVVCRKGTMVNCQYANVCSPVGNMCTYDPARPLFCPAMGTIGPGCYLPGTECSTRAACNGGVFSCPTGFKVDCAMMKCMAL